MNKTTQLAQLPEQVAVVNAGLEVFTWTLRPENKFLTKPFRAGDAAQWGAWRGEYESVFATGVDGVFADQPDLAIAARDGA